MRRNVKLVGAGIVVTVVVLLTVAYASLQLYQRGLEDDPPLHIATCERDPPVRTNAGLELWRWPPGDLLGVRWVWRIEWTCREDDQQRDFYSWVEARSEEQVSSGTMERVIVELDSDEDPERLVTPGERYDLTLNDSWLNPLCLSIQCDRQRYWHVEVQDSEAVLVARSGDWVLYELDSSDLWR